jgi:hypothetical protein
MKGIFLVAAIATLSSAFTTSAWAPPLEWRDQWAQTIRKAVEDPAPPPETPRGPKFSLSFGASLKDHLKPAKRTGKSHAQLCKAIQAKAVKCLREAEAKAQWSTVCKPQVDEYVTRCKKHAH